MQGSVAIRAIDSHGFDAGYLRTLTVSLFYQIMALSFSQTPKAGQTQF